MTRRLAGYGNEKYAGLVNPGKKHFNGVVRTHEDALAIPLKVKKPTVWFVNSMSDLFHKDVPFDFIDRVFAVMALAKQHTFQVLTKRPERMAEYLTERYARPDGGHNDRPDMVLDAAYSMDDERLINLNRIPDAWTPAEFLNITWPLPNVWLGTSVENQEAADERIPHLLRCPAAVRWLSCEPLLGPVDIRPWLVAKSPAPGYMNGNAFVRSHAVNRLDWIVIGGESGPGARPFDIAWARDLIRQCEAASVPVFVKQLGAKPVVSSMKQMDFGFTYEPRMSGGYELALSDSKGGNPEEWPADLRVRQYPHSAPVPS